MNQNNLFMAQGCHTKLIQHEFEIKSNQNEIKLN